MGCPGEEEEIARVWCRESHKYLVVNENWFCWESGEVVSAQL